MGLPYHFNPRAVHNVPGSPGDTLGVWRDLYNLSQVDYDILWSMHVYAIGDVGDVRDGLGNSEGPWSYCRMGQAPKELEIKIGQRDLDRSL